MISSILLESLCARMADRNCVWKLGLHQLRLNSLLCYLNLFVTLTTIKSLSARPQSELLRRRPKFVMFMPVASGISHRLSGHAYGMRK